MEAARAWVAALCLLLLVGGREGVETGEFALGEEGFTSFEGAVEGEVDAGLQERSVLLRFKASIPNWDAVAEAIRLDGWDEDTPVFLWSGVTFDLSMRLTRLELLCNRFITCTPAQGSLFPELASLPHLEELVFSGNEFSGAVPEEWIAAGSFPSLRLLNLESNHLAGPLPAPNGGWSKLETLRMGWNNFTGGLPAGWADAGVMPALASIELDGNPLGGTLPAAWGTGGGLSQLTTLAAPEARITGSLPAAWGRSGGMALLQRLDLGGNRLEGSLPAQWSKQGRFPQLQILELSRNQLSGSLPPEWGQEGSFPVLQRIFIEFNALTGPLPASWAAMMLLKNFHAASNRLSGSLPPDWGVPGALPELNSLKLQSNALTGPLPGEWGREGAFTSLNRLHLNENALTGPLPGSWGGPTALPQLVMLTLGSNALTGTLPATWGGGDALPKLVTLELSSNSIRGPLPEEWGAAYSFTSLVALNVSDNKLSGELPAGWGTVAPSLDALSLLAISGNAFSGAVPPSWGRLQALAVVYAAPGNLGLCRPLPYTGQYALCDASGVQDSRNISYTTSFFAVGFSDCLRPVQLRASCRAGGDTWGPVTDTPIFPSAPPPTGAVVLFLAALAGAALALAGAAYLGLRARRIRQWAAALKAEKAAEAKKAALHDPAGSSGGGAPDSPLVRGQGRGGRQGTMQLAAALLAECSIDPADVMFCRTGEDALVPLGAGAYGQVYKAYLYGVHPVAVKVFQTHGEVPQDDFWREISILRTCRHSNIVQFQGASVEGGATMMVTELMEGGDLYRALQAGEVTWYRRGLRIAVDVAQALHCLHRRGVLHFDIKSPNILLSKEYGAKVGDVGWAQILCQQYVTGNGGTFNWAAPEQLIGLKCTAKADIYSYGLVLWEICTRETPVRGQVRNVRVPEECPAELAALIKECLDVDPDKRPTAEACIRRLQALQAAPTEGSPLLGSL